LWGVVLLQRYGRDGSVVTWGSSSEGGDSGLVASQLVASQLDGTVKVIDIRANGKAFAALRAEWLAVVTWGNFILWVGTAVRLKNSLPLVLKCLRMLQRTIFIPLRIKVSPLNQNQMQAVA
jgi:hypothetical protein